MKNTLLAVVIAAASGLTGLAPRAIAAQGDSITFNLKVSAGAAACLATNATGRVTISDLGVVQNMHVEVLHLPPNTEFTTFLIQVPKSPFGLAWYQGTFSRTPTARVSEISLAFSVKRRSSMPRA